MANLKHNRLISYERTPFVRWYYTFSHRNAVAFLVQQAAHLRHIAIAFDDVLDRRGLHQKGVVLAAGPIDRRPLLAHLVVGRQQFGMLFYVLVDVFVGTMLSFLENRTSG